MKRLNELRTSSPDKKQTQVTANGGRNETHQTVIITPCNEDKKVEKTHPDGGWGWVVVIAAFLTQWIVVGLQNSSGVIFNELVKKYNESRGDTGLISLFFF